MINENDRERENDPPQSDTDKTSKPSMSFIDPHDSKPEKNDSRREAASDTQDITGIPQPPDKFKRWRRLFQYIIPAITGLLTLLVLIFQLRIYHQQVEEMRLDRRAWLAVEQVKSTPEVGKPFRVSVTVTNTGRTFARQCRALTRMKTAVGTNIPDFATEIRKGVKEVSSDASQSLIAPNTKHEMVLDSYKISGSMVTDAGIAQLKNGDIRIFVFGELTYNDIFNHSHWLIFCQVLSYDPRSTENGGWDYIDYKNYNETGEGAPFWKY